MHICTRMSFFTTVHPTYYCNNCINRTYTIQYFLNIVLLLPHSLHFISLITTTKTYTCTFYILSYLHFLPQLLLVPILLILHIYFLLYISIYLFTYSTLHMHILCTFLLFCTSGWMLNCTSLPQYSVLCAMTIKLNLI